MASITYVTIKYVREKQTYVIESEYLREDASYIYLKCGKFLKTKVEGISTRTVNESKEPEIETDFFLQSPDTENGADRLPRL